MFYRQESDHLEAEETVKSRERQLRLQQLGLLLVFLVSFFHLVKGQAPWGATVMKHIAEVAPQIEHPKNLVMLPAWLHSDIDHPGVLRPKEHAIIGLWWGAAIAAGLSFLLLATSPWWMPRGEKEGRENLEVEENNDENAGGTGLAKLVSSGPIFYVLVGLAMVTGGWLRAPLLDHSLWNDEEYAMRRFAHGSWEKAEDGAMKFTPVPWQETLFENRDGNNHLLNSLLTRLSLSTWSSFTKAPAGKFSEAALRAPSVIAGVLTIGLIAFLGWEIGMPWVGIGAAWLLALHPWHLRYSAEAKGYALMMFFVCLALLGLVRAMKKNRNLDWQMFAIGEAGFMLSFAGAIYVAIAVNLIAVIELLIRNQPRRLVALIAFNLLAAIPVVVWTLPSVPQVMAFMHRDSPQNQAPSSDRLRDLGSHVAAGVLYNNPEPEEHLGTSWLQMAEANHVEVLVLAYGVGLFLVLGLVAAFFENSAARVIIFGIGLGGALAFWQGGAQHQPGFAWYYIYLVIPAALAVALASVRLQLLPAFIVILMVGFFGKATELPRSIFRDHDRQPIRETVAATRAKHPEALTGTFGVSDRQALSYDPQVHLLSTPADVDNLLAQGKQLDVPVFVYFCGVEETSRRKPDLVKRVAASQDFIAFKQFKGLEAMFTYHSFVWAGSPP